MSSGARHSPHSSPRRSLTSTPSRLSRYSDSHDGQAESSSQADSRRSIPEHSPAPEPADLKSSKRRTRHSGGFLLGHALGRGKERSLAEDEGGERKGKGKSPAVGNSKTAPSSLTRSAQSSLGTSPLSHHTGHEQQGSHGAARGTVDGAEEMLPVHSANGVASSAASVPALDPTQLVQMALSLSEGRRRHASAGLAVAATPMDSRRVRSAGAQVVTVGPGSPLGNDFLHPTLAQRMTSPESASPSPSDSAAFNASVRRPAGIDSAITGIAPGTIDELEPEVEYQFSAFTLSRADKARQFFELSSEYRRLLQCLPQLRPDASANLNNRFSPPNSPDSVYITRFQSDNDNKHGPGRDYNPLQVLRNKRTRKTRDRRPLEPSVAAFEDLSKVKQYVNTVEEEMAHPSYRAVSDSVFLPPFPGSEDTADPIKSQVTSIGHRRSETASSRILRPDSYWSLAPAELFADALWVEQGNNKRHIEDRHGHHLLPHGPRASFESTGNGRRSKESQHDSVSQGSAFDNRNSSAAEVGGAGTLRGRKKRKFLSMSISRVDDEVRKRLSWHRTREEDSSSDVSLIGGENGQRTANVEDNYLPLERHMQKMIEQDKLEASPDVISPDKWSRLPEDQEDQDLDDDRLSQQVTADANGYFGSTELPSNDARTADGQGAESSRMTDVEYSRPGTDEDGNDSTAPNSPTRQSFVPAFGMSLSPPASRQQSPHRKSRRQRIGLHRSGSKERNKIEQTDFAINDKETRANRQASAEDAQRSSTESVRPSFLRRHMTTNSIASTIHETDDARSASYRGTKEPGSSVARFFKGGRLGELVRGESSRFGERSRRTDSPDFATSTSDVSSHGSDTSEDEEVRSRRRLKKPPNDVSRKSAESSQVRSETARRRVKLPAFRPANYTPSEHPSGDPIPSQDKARREQSQSSRFSRLAPPRIEMTGISPRSSPSFGMSPAQTPDERPHKGRRVSYGFLDANGFSRSNPRLSVASLGAPGSMGAPGATKFRYTSKMPMTGLTNADSELSRRPSLAGKRHWSISDRAYREQTNRVTTQDIARVRALFLSSGIKAKELCRHAETVPEMPSDFLAQAVSASSSSGNGNSGNHSVSRREEFALAGQLLSKRITTTLSAAEHEMQDFRTSGAPALHRRLDELKQKVAEKLTPLVHQSADEADAFTAELSTQQTLAVKQVNDAVDDLLRNRRRTLRFARRAGFTLLEWVLLGLMWGVWFIVVVLRLSKGFVLRVAHGIRWVIWA